MYTLLLVLDMSQGLSKRLSQLVKGGRRLNDDSCLSESTLSQAMSEVVEYATLVFSTIGGTTEHLKMMTLYDCQGFFHLAGGPEPREENKKVFMRPDGGVIVTNIGGNRIPILITEDKVQGTNDLRFQDGLTRQATGNAIERGAKNMRGAEMLFAGQDIFPYLIFASGCDFHTSETIAKRLEMMNFGYPNHYIEINQDTSCVGVDHAIDCILPQIKIRQVCGHKVASVFVKAHKWNMMKHGSSLWKKEEIVKICKHVIDLVFQHHLEKLST